MRDLRIDAAVAALLGAELTGRLRAGPYPAEATCRSCGRVAAVDAGVPLSVVAAVAPGRTRVVFAHAGCEPSGVVPEAAAAPPAPTAAHGRAWLAGGLAVLAAEAAAAVVARQGEDVADLATAALLRAGLGLVPALDAAALAGLPALPGWAARVGGAGRGVRVWVADAGGEALFDLHVDTPPGWLAAARTRGHLVLLAGGMLGLAAPGAGPAGLAGAAAAGRLAGGLVPVGPGRPTLRRAPASEPPYDDETPGA